MRIQLTAFFLCASAGVASANGYVINEHDAQATGRGNASTATDGSPSSIVYNIGGLAVGKGTQVRIGAALVVAKGSFTPEGSTSTTDTTSGPAVLPQLYIGSRVHDMVAVGVGVSAPFGLAVQWPDDAPTNDVVHKVSLQTVFITPSVGINLHKYVPGLTLGGGVDIVPSAVELQQDIMFGADKGTAHVSGSGTGIGGRFGLMYRPKALDKLSLGAMWRSKVKIDYAGKADFDAPDPYRSQLPPDGDAATSLTLPQSIVGGAAYRPTKDVEIELDAVWMQWSSFKSLTLELPGDTTQSIPQDWQNKTSIRFGAEYGLPKQHAAIRAGYTYDPTPVPANRVSVELPDANRQVVTIGGSNDVKPNYAVHLGLLAVLPTSRHTDDSDPYLPKYKGTYDISALVATLTLAGRFGK